MASTVWSREDPPFSCLLSAGATQHFRLSTKIWYYADFKGSGALAWFLVLLTVLEYLIHSFVSSSQFDSGYIS